MTTLSCVLALRLSLTSVLLAAPLVTACPIPNPSFEEVEDGKPVGWRAVPPETKGFRWTASTDRAYRGSYALAIQLAMKEGNDAHIKLLSDTFPVEGGKLHRLSGWMYWVARTKRGNASARGYFHWYDKRGEEVTTSDLNYLELPYESVEAWRPVDLVVPAPPEAREARIAVVVHVRDPSSSEEVSLHIDDLRLHAFETLASPPENAKSWTYFITQDYVDVKRVAVEKDPAARLGRAVHASAERDGDTLGLISGPLIAHQEPGLYRVSYRLKVADNKGDKPVCRVYVASSRILNSHTLRGKTIRAPDFKEANRYQEISIDCFRPPVGGMQYLCTWLGNVDLWLDTVSVTELRRFSDRDLLSFYPQDTGPVNPDPNGGLYVIRGLSFPLYRIDELAGLLKTKVVGMSYLSTVARNSVLKPPFPSEPTELSALRAVIMADVDAESFGISGRNALRSFVEGGGTLVILGGWISYAQGKMKNTFLEELLPVTVSDAFDRHPCVPPALLSAATEWRDGDGLRWEENPACLWIHRVVAKPGANVLVTAGGRPFLVVAQYGKGKVIACTGTVLGKPGARVTPFWEWQDWPALLASAMN